MSAASILRLVLLAAIWGASFLFMRLGVPELGPAWLMFGRVFGVLWGHLFLHEAIGWHTLFGAAIVIAGTILVTGFRITALFTPAKEMQ